MNIFTGHKTIKVEDLKTFVNTLLANKNICKSEKIGYCYLLESVLLDTNNYRGWNAIPGSINDYERRYY